MSHIGKKTHRRASRKFVARQALIVSLGVYFAPVIYVSASQADRDVKQVERQAATLVGDGQLCVFPGICGDNGLATSAQLSAPAKVVPTSNGDEFFIVDSAANRVRKLDKTGKITTVAGDGQACALATDPCGDGALATAARLNNPQGAAVGSSGELYIADTGNNRIRRVGSDGKITTVAGTGVAGFSGDGADAVNAQLQAPADVAVRGNSVMLIADSLNNRIRRVSLGAGNIIDTVAGSPIACAVLTDPCGEGRVPTAANLKRPTSVAFLPGSGFVFAEPDLGRIRSVINNDGTETVNRVAGALGPQGFSGDNGNAVSAQLQNPQGVFATANNEILIADTGNHRIRLVDSRGVITTLFGSTACPTPTDVCGDGGAAVNARFAQPAAAFLAKNNAVIVADTANRRVRVMQRKDVPVDPREPQTTTETQPQVEPTISVATREPEVPTFYSLIEVAKTVGVEPAEGASVLVRPPGEEEFRPVEKAEVLPNKTEVDVTRGSAILTIRTPEEGVHVQRARVSGGRFIAVQQGSDKDGVTDFILSSPIRGCPKVPVDRVAVTLRAKVKDKAGKKAANKRVRRLWVQTKGKRVRTRGRGAAGAVRGTRWATIDDCRKRIKRRLGLEQTRIFVAEGIVAVRDFVRHKTFLVKKGKHHIAYLRKKKRKR